MNLGFSFELEMDSFNKNIVLSGVLTFMGEFWYHIRHLHGEMAEPG